VRILTVGSLYPPHHLGGYELVWRAAVEALRDAGHEVRVLCTDTRLAPGSVEADPAFVRRELRWYWRDHDFPRLGLGERLAVERHNHAVLGSELARGVDLVSWWAMGGMSLSLVERVRRDGPPAIGWVNDDWLIYGPEVDQWTRAWRRLPLRSVRGIPVRPSLGTAARWVFCSDSVRRAAERLRGPLADTAVLYQGVAPEFTAAPARAAWEGRLLCPGRLDARKGLGTAVEALARLDGSTLTVIGDGDPAVADGLRSQAARLGVGDRLRLEPARPRAALGQAYAESDAVVFGVEWAEPYGLVPLEAMAVGRPVVATGRGGSGEYLRDGENCVLFEAGDAAALARAVARLADDPALRERLRAGGLATAARLTEAAWTRAVVAEHDRLGTSSVADALA
jgi:glycogen synthase